MLFIQVLFVLHTHAWHFTKIQVMELPSMAIEKNKTGFLWNLMFFGPNCRQKDIRKSVVNFLPGWAH